MTDYTFRDGMRYRIEGVTGPELDLPSTGKVYTAEETIAALDPPANPNVYSDEHTGPLVIVYTD